MWRIDEPIGFFKEALLKENFPVEDGNSIKNEEKAIQWFASRYLLQTVFPMAIPLQKKPKPILYNGPNVSFSHSENMVGLMLSNHPAGLDIQVFNEKLIRIRSKFTEGNESAIVNAPSNLAALSLLWSIKEAVFKYYETDLPFKSIRLLSHDSVENIAKVEVLRKGKLSYHTLLADFIDELSLAYILE